MTPLDDTHPPLQCLWSSVRAMGMRTAKSRWGLPHAYALSFSCCVRCCAMSAGGGWMLVPAQV